MKGKVTFLGMPGNIVIFMVLALVEEWGGWQRGPHQMPRASGQSRAMPEASSSGDTGLSNRK